MSTAKNTEEQGPSVGGVIFCAVIVALVGALLGFLFLASVPPTSFKSVADLQAYLEKNPEPVLLDMSYFEGRISRGRSWEQKRETLLNGSATTVELTADELNAWMSSKFRNSSPAASDEDAPDIVILPGVPNFFIDEKEGFFADLFSSHPPLRKRVKWLADMSGTSPEAIQHQAGESAQAPAARPAEKIEAESARWFMQDGSEWLGPFGLMELAAMPGFGAQSWVRRSPWAVWCPGRSARNRVC